MATTSSSGMHGTDLSLERSSTEKHNCVADGGAVVGGTVEHLTVTEEPLVGRWTFMAVEHLTVAEEPIAGRWTLMAGAIVILGID